MSAPRPPTDSKQPQSPLSEAVEQAAGAASRWCDDVVKFAENQADLLSSGDYGVSDLATAQVDLLRIWVRNTVLTAGVLSDNLALLSFGRPTTTPPPRRFNVGVSIPAGVSAKLRTSDLLGQLLAYRIASSKIRLNPDSAPSQVNAREIDVEVEVDTTGVPNDTYEGVLFSEEGAVQVPIRVAIDELGQPSP
jgi:hypothetical protein